MTARPLLSLFDALPHAAGRPAAPTVLPARRRGAGPKKGTP